ncbi:MAG: hypothetical protein IT329_08050 [Caldilineaceae bacterium]|nr:hypothetical protein [Caldilineaceae bacterium]
MQIDLMRRLQLWTLAILLALLPGLAVRPAQAAPPIQGYTYEECSRADESAIQAEMEAIALGLLTTASSGLDVDALVARQWNELEVGATLDRAVDDAVLHIQQQTGYWDRLVSGWSATQAEALAHQVATDAFTSPAFQGKIEELSAALATGLVAEMEAHAARSASSALLCLQSYVGERYSATLYAAFAQRIDQDVTPALALDEAGAPIAISPVELHLKALGGVGVIVAAQITRKIATSLTQKIAGRLAGKVAGRVLGRLGSSVIPYIGWVVGAGLIVWDLVEGSQGALPQIRSALQAEEVKQEVRTEIADAVRDGLQGEIQGLAATLAATLVGEWQGFCAEQGELCALAAENPPFRAYLATTPVDQLARLSRQVAVFDHDLEPEQLNASLADGTFGALMALPDAALALLAATHDPQTTVAWDDLAGDHLDFVIGHELYTVTSPEQLSSTTFLWLVAVEDNDIIHNLFMVEPAILDALTRAPAADFRAAAATLPADDLVWLAKYLAGQSQAEARATVAQLTQGTATIAALQMPPTPQPSAAPVEGPTVESVSQPGGAADVAAPAGRSSPGYPDGVLVAAAMLLLFLLGWRVIMSLRGDSYGNSG